MKTTEMLSSFVLSKSGYAQTQINIEYVVDKENSEDSVILWVLGQICCLKSLHIGLQYVKMWMGSVLVSAIVWIPKENAPQNKNRIKCIGGIKNFQKTTTKCSAFSDGNK